MGRGQGWLRINRLVVHVTRRWQQHDVRDAVVVLELRLEELGEGREHLPLEELLVAHRQLGRGDRRVLLVDKRADEQ